jgi:septal ring factor EnvC (AmiA/AmiB activator)
MSRTIKILMKNAENLERYTHLRQIVFSAVTCITLILSGAAWFYFSLKSARNSFIEIKEVATKKFEQEKSRLEDELKGLEMQQQARKDCLEKMKRSVELQEQNKDKFEREIKDLNGQIKFKEDEKQIRELELNKLKDKKRELDNISEITWRDFIFPFDPDIMTPVLPMLIWPFDKRPEKGLVEKVWMKFRARVKDLEEAIKEKVLIVQDLINSINLINNKVSSLERGLQRVRDELKDVTANIMQAEAELEKFENNKREMQDKLQELLGKNVSGLSGSVERPINVLSQTHGFFHVLTSIALVVLGMRVGVRCLQFTGFLRDCQLFTLNDVN